MRRHRKIDPARLFAVLFSTALPFIILFALVVFTERHLLFEDAIEVEILAPAQVPELEPPVETPPPPETEKFDAEVVAEVAVELPATESTEALIDAPPPLLPEVPKPTPVEAVCLIKSPVTMKSLVADNRGLARRQGAIRKFGGSAQAETTVLKALRWLRRQQREDGCWKFKGEGDATAFALLAYLSHGEDFTSAEFGPTVKRAVKYLVNHHSNNMSVYALAESAAVIRSPVLSEIAATAVSELCEKAHRKPFKANSGGMLQRYAAVMALVSARLAKLEVPELEETTAIFRRAFEEMRDGKAADFTKVRGEGAWRFMIASVCLQYLGEGENPTTRQLLERLNEIWVPATLGKTPIACCPVRSNYFSTMMFFNAGGEIWNEWNRGMLSAYESRQETEGDGGYWHCEDQHIGEQPFWPTCYIAHQLMIYYRYLPTYSQAAWDAAPPVKPPREVKAEVDVEVDI